MPWPRACLLPFIYVRVEFALDESAYALAKHLMLWRKSHQCAPLLGARLADDVGACIIAYVALWRRT
jgi:hypothetical protein